MWEPVVVGNPMSGTPASQNPPRLLLHVGVLSCNQTGRLERRQIMRELIPSHPQALLQFVMAEDEAEQDAACSNVLLLALHVNHSVISLVRRRKIGKFLLQNTFFRHAARHSTAHWVARADDDALFSLATITDMLRRVPAVHARLSVFGPFGKFYAWLPTLLQPTCWRSDPWGFSLRGGRDAPRTFAPCSQPGAEGPFPFAAGPFVAFSAALARSLARHVDRDEEYALGEWTHTPLRHPLRGNQTFAPEDPRHPSNSILLEDVYFGYLLYRHWGEAPLTLIDVGTSLLEVGPQSALSLGRLAGAGRGMTILHGIKSAHRHLPWLVSNRSRSEELLRPRVRALYCGGGIERGQAHEHEQQLAGLGRTLHRVVGTCGRWRMCLVDLETPDPPLWCAKPRWARWWSSQNGPAVAIGGENKAIDCSNWVSANTSTELNL